MKNKAIALVSGGLDSLLAARVILEQGIEVKGVCFVMSFASRDNEAFKRNVLEAAFGAGIKVEILDISEEFLSVMKRPEHGFGANMNPCIDCKILMLRKAKEIMEKTGADFVVTGEVIGERPMSQRRDALNTIKKESGLEGYLLRPLCAKRLEETVPEKEGIVDRKALLDIHGRSRERQFALAEKYGITKYFTPAGGCLLTDPGFSKRLLDLMRSSGLDLEDIKLLKYGRHFRLDDNTKVVVGRDEKDNVGVISLKRNGDILLHIKEKAGPYVLLRGGVDHGSIKRAASICLTHSKGKHDREEVIEFWEEEDNKKEIRVTPMARDEIDKIRI